LRKNIIPRGIIVLLAAGLVAVTSAVASGVPAASASVQAAGPDFVADLKGRIPLQFAGAWIASTDSGEVLHVAITDADVSVVRTIEATASMYGLSGSIALDTVKYSAAQLEAFYNELAANVSGWPATAIARFGVRADLNKVEIVLTVDDPALVDLTLGIIPNDALEVTVDPGAALTAGSNV
jgi:hypothetical protein